MAEIKNFYRYEFFKSVGQGLVNPFISIFALTLGASNFLIGSLSGSVHLVYIISQVVFSVLLLKKGGKISVLFFATIFWALMWVVIGLSKNPYELITFLSIQAIFSALITLSWTDLLVNSIPGYKRGKIIGELNWWNGFGAILATLTSGYVLTNYGFINFVFFVATGFGILGSLNFFQLRILRLPAIPVPKIKIKGSLTELKKNKDLLTLLKAKAFLQFSTGLAGPFFAVYVVTKLGGSLIDVAIISVISSISHLLFYKPWGFIVDFIGRKATMLSCILLIATIPLVYAVAPSVLFLYFFVIFGAIGWSGFNIAAFAYFSDVAEKKNVFQLTAFYNSSVEISGIGANFLGGILAQNFGIFTVLIISSILRLMALIFFIGIKEKTGYREVVKFETTLHPFYFIESSMTIYSILFSTLRKDVIRRIGFMDKFRRLSYRVLKRMGIR